jgi:hypothetical protein
VVDIYIVSKNRPAQFELLLRSIGDHLSGYGSLNCIIKCDEEYRDDYQELINLYELSHIFETDDICFKKCMYEYFCDASELSRFTMFLMDDNVILRPFSFESEKFKSFYEHDQFRGILALSMRLHPGVKKCYAYGDTSVIAPTFTFRRGINTFHWYRQQGDFGYPMSLDGNIYRTGDLRKNLLHFAYKNPNQLEGALMGFPPPMRPLLACYNDPYVVNIPWNKVQDENQNRCSDEDVHGMNKLFSAYNKRIKTDGIYNTTPDAVHHVYPLGWEDRNGD